MFGWLLTLHGLIVNGNCKVLVVGGCGLYSSHFPLCISIVAMNNIYITTLLIVYLHP